MLICTKEKNKLEVFLVVTRSIIYDSPTPPDPSLPTEQFLQPCDWGAVKEVTVVTWDNVGRDKYINSISYNTMKKMLPIKSPKCFIT